jgi:hypothetical protein
MMNEKRIREYRAEVIEHIKQAAKLHNLYSWERACERVWTLDFILAETNKAQYIHPEDRFAFEKTQEAAK